MIFFKKFFLFVVFTLFSTSVFSNPGFIFNSIKGKLSKWTKAREAITVPLSIQRRDPNLFNFLGTLPMTARMEALGRIISRDQDDLYFAFYSHLENQSDLVSVIGGETVEDATNRLVVVYSSPLREFSAWFDSQWTHGDRDIFLKLWDMESGMTRRMTDIIKINHLVGNPDLLIRWFGKSTRNRLIYFVWLALNAVKKKMGHSNFEKLFEAFLSEPFGQTILRAMNENRLFQNEFMEIRRFIKQSWTNPEIIEVRTEDLGSMNLSYSVTQMSLIGEEVSGHYDNIGGILVNIQ